MRFKRLNEELLNNIFTVIIPIKVTLLIDDPEIDESDFISLQEDAFKKTTDNISKFLDTDIYSYIRDSEPDLEKQLNTSPIDISEIDIDIDEFQNIPVSSGIASFDVEINEPVDKGRAKQLFNTLLNDNVIYKEFTTTVEDEFDIFDMTIFLEKESDIGIGEI